MKISDFKIGEDFYTSVAKWRCTDIGSFSITAIRWPDPQHEPHEYEHAHLWLAGPPYVLPQEVFDEKKMEGAYRSPNDLFSRTERSSHPGFPDSDMKKLMSFHRLGVLSPYEKRYRSGLMSLDRVRGDEVLHAYDWEDGPTQDCQIKVYDLFRRSWSQVELTQWLSLPICTEEDLLRVSKLFSDPHAERS